MIKLTFTLALLFAASIVCAQNKESKLEIIFLMKDSTTESCRSKNAMVSLGLNTGEINVICKDNKPNLSKGLDDFVNEINLTFSAIIKQTISQIMETQNTGTTFQLVGYTDFNGNKDQCNARISFVNLKNRGKVEDLKADLMISCPPELLNNPKLKEFGVISYTVQLFGADLNAGIK